MRLAHESAPRTPRTLLFSLFAALWLAAVPDLSTALAADPPAAPPEGAAPAAPAADPYVVFKPLDPPPAGTSRETIEAKWTSKLGESYGTLARVFAAYEAEPNIVNALTALKQFKILAKDADLRKRAIDTNTPLFLTLDALKYELALQSTLRLNDARRRLGKPLMVDDFSSVPAVALPDGHPELARMLCAPTTEGGRPVMLAGVANRASAYDAEDAETLQLIMDTVWRVTERRRAERALRESEERLRVALEERKRNAEKQARLQANLAQADRLASMGRLAAGVAHEVNNPLAFVLYNLESLAEDLPAAGELVRGLVDLDALHARAAFADQHRCQGQAHDGRRREGRARGRIDD